MKKIFGSYVITNTSSELIFYLFAVAIYCWKFMKFMTFQPSSIIYINSAILDNDNFFVIR